MNTETQTLNAPEKLSAKTRLGYAVGMCADSIPFNLFFTYFLFFFTNVVGLSPVYAGMISFVAILWAAFADPIAGYMSDNCNSKAGRRRPFIIGSSIPLVICMVLLFTSVSFGPLGSFIYYLVVALLFFTFYAAYAIPFFALGAEISQDYQERTTLRSITGVFIYLSVWFVTAGPMMVLDRVTKAGGTPQKAWVLSALLLGLIVFLTALICFKASKGKELSNTRDDMAEMQGKNKTNIFANYGQLFKIRAIRMVLGASLASNISISIVSSAFVYLMTYNLGFDAATQATFWSFYTIMIFVIIPIDLLIAKLIGKKQALILCQTITVVTCLLYYFTGINGMTQLLIYSFLCNLGNVCSWTVGVSLTYDVCEIDEYVYEKRREGAITGFVSFVMKLGSAVAMWLSGILLTLIGYDGSAATQSAGALQGLLALNTLLPAICVGISVTFAILYPINKKNFSALMQALELKKAGKPYTTDGFKELLPKKFQ